MSWALRSFIIMSLVLALSGLSCADKRVADFRSDSNAYKAVIFGHVKVFYDDQDVTTDAVVYFHGGDVMALERDGFAAAHVEPGRSGITKVRLKSTGAEYPIADMALNTGKAATRTYFGHLTVSIVSNRVNGEHLGDTWTWKVDNRWQDAMARWNRSYGRENRKFFVGLAARTGKGAPASRGVAAEKPNSAVGP